MPYPMAQIEALIELLETLFRDVPTLQEITTHWYISPGRKVDPNPLLPLQDIRGRILGHDNRAEAELEASSIGLDEEPVVRISVPGDTLNLRAWPSFNPNIIGSVPDGALVPLLRVGEFDGRQWLRIRHGGREGWIVGSYATPEFPLKESRA
jgi:N-acetylmuramoyl-L-alanine amidase